MPPRQNSRFIPPPLAREGPDLRRDRQDRRDCRGRAKCDSQAGQDGQDGQAPTAKPYRRCKLLPLAVAVRRGHADLADLADRFLVAKLLICFCESASLRHRGFFFV